jgi:hypothetical protein
VRHLVSILLAPVLGLIAYILLGFSALQVRVENGWDGDNIIGVLALLAAGAAYAGLVIPRLSPIGPAFVGLIYLALGIWLFSDLSSFVDTVPSDLLGLDNAGFGAGIYLIPLAIPLLATIVSPNRWRGRVRPAPAGAGAGLAPPPGFAPPQEPPPSFDSPPQYGNSPPQYGNQPGIYSGAPPIGTPYSGPPSYDSGPSYGPPPGSPVAPSGYDPGQQQQYGGYPPDPMSPEQTRRIQ